MEPIQDAGKRIREWQKAKFGDHGVTMMPTVEVTMEPIQDDRYKRIWELLTDLWAGERVAGGIEPWLTDIERLEIERDRLVAERDRLIQERDSLIAYLGETADAIENRNVQREEVAALLRKTQARFI
jgi:hypothetical protein